MARIATPASLQHPVPRLVLADQAAEQIVQALGGVGAENDAVVELHFQLANVSSAMLWSFALLAPGFAALKMLH